MKKQNEKETNETIVERKMTLEDAQILHNHYMYEKEYENTERVKNILDTFTEEEHEELMYKDMGYPGCDY